MKNSFLNKAKRASALSDVLESIKTPLQKGRRGQYVSGLGSFSKLNKKDLKSFVELVKQYNKAVGLKTEVADLDTFVNYTQGVKPGSKFNLISGSVKIKRTDRASAERYYVMYWADRIITEHNKRVEQAQKLSESGTFAFPRLDIQKATPEDKSREYRTIKLEEFKSIVEKHEENLAIRSKPSSYKMPSNIKKYADDLLSDDKHKLKYYKNTKLLFLDNLIYAMRKANWSSALALIEKAIREGHGAAVYNAYIESGVNIVFEYNEQISSEIVSAEQKYINSLKNILGA